MDKIQDYINIICLQIKNKSVHNDIKAELSSHIEEIIEEEVSHGITMEQATKTALKRIGDPITLGRNINNVHKPRIDFKLLFSLFTLVLTGFFALAITTDYLSDSTYLINQGIWTFLGIICFFAIYLLNYKLLLRAELPFYLYTLISIIALNTLPFLNTLSSEFIPWLYNFFMETIKITFIIAFAINLTKHSDQNQLSIKRLIPYMLIPIMIALLNTGKPTLILLAVIFTIMVKNYKLPIKDIFIAFLVVLPSLVLYLMTLPPYQLNRLKIFLNPTADPLGTGYQIIQSQKALISAGLWGQGFNINKNILPQPFEENIFSLLINQTGWILGIVIILLMIFLIYRIFWSASNCKDSFGSLLSKGIGTMFTFNIIWNIGMQIGILPPAGVKLPLFSYSPASVLINFIALGLVFNVAKNIKPNSRIVKEVKL